MTAESVQPSPLASPRHSYTPRRFRSARGFTLVELMIVVTVIGILATFAIPYLQRATARARRAEMQMVLDKLHVYFINLFENDANGSFGTTQFPAPFTSAWNPDPATPTGQPAQWSTSRNGWQQIPFAFEGGLKLRYMYTTAATGSMTITVVGDMPGLGPSTSVTINGVSGNYSYVEVLQGPTIMPPTEFPSSF